MREPEPTVVVPRGFESMDDVIDAAGAGGERLEESDDESDADSTWMDQASKSDELCIKNEKLCIKNEEFCSKTDEFQQDVAPVSYVGRYVVLRKGVTFG